MRTGARIANGGADHPGTGIAYGIRGVKEEEKRINKHSFFSLSLCVAASSRN